MINLEEIKYTISVINKGDGTETEFVVYQGRENLDEMLKQIEDTDATVIIKANHPATEKTAGIRYTDFKVDSLRSAVSGIKDLFSTLE